MDPIENSFWRLWGKSKTQFFAYDFTFMKNKREEASICGHTTVSAAPLLKDETLLHMYALFCFKDLNRYFMKLMFFCFF